MFGFLKKLGGPKKATPPKTIPLRPRDCHSHVVPAVDDGSRSLGESLAMLRLLGDAGASTVIATPHIYPGRFDNEPDPLRRAFEQLQETAAADAEVNVELELGAEHYLDESLPGRIERGDFIAFGKENYVLFETAIGEQVPLGLLEVVHTLVERGYTPLVAHVERYRYLRGEEGRELFEDLRAAGAKFQVNRSVGKMNVPGRGPRGEVLAWLLERGWVDEVGSDLHRPTAEGRPYAVNPVQPGDRA